MSTILPDAPPTEWTIADVQARLAGFPADRIRVYPTPGTATEQDLLAAEARSNRICELIDGTLVEKPMASLESVLALVLSHFLHLYLDTHNLGVLAGEAGLLRILPGQIRAPDVSFIRWDRFAGRQLPKAAIFAVARLGRGDPLGRQHARRNGSQAPRLFPLGRAAGLVRRAQDPHGTRLYGLRCVDRDPMRWFAAWRRSSARL